MFNISIQIQLILSYNILFKQFIRKMSSELCLAEGTVLSPADSARLRLFSMRFCPYAQRTRLVLHHKKIPHETINVNLKFKPSWLLSRNPAGLVPVIEYKGNVVYESAICGEFLEEEFPQYALLPSTPNLRASQRILMYNFDKSISALHSLLSVDEEKRQKAGQTIEKLLENCEELLKKNKSKFMTGDKVQMLDFHMWPFFERFPAMSQLRNDPVVPEARFPLLNGWMKSMEDENAVKLTRLPNDWHAQFLLSLAQRNPQYDIGLNVTKI